MSGLFGLNTNYDLSKIIINAVPWEVTTSYGDGASLGPEAVLKASPQLDLYDYHFEDASKLGLHYQSVNGVLKAENDHSKSIAKRFIQKMDQNIELSSADIDTQKQVNQKCKQVNEAVYLDSSRIFGDDKIPAVLGGDHSTPEGLIKAAIEHHKGDIGILHIDAHADLRKSYQGFHYSHASIMRNVMEFQLPPTKLVQVGIRDFCKEEWDYIHQPESSITTFFNRTLCDLSFSGQTWGQVCDKIINHLPRTVHVSIDVDGLSPDLCPNTGTPVPGGISYDQLIHLLKHLVNSGRNISSFDLVEVAPGVSEWDGNVGARTLYQLCGWTLASQQYLNVRGSHGL